ncbi:MAG: hypothetical protein JST09_01445 [Bacteroidetes bacterium]|nr:hypothetical protein [Bacteroidota bacterium]
MRILVLLVLAAQVSSASVISVGSISDSIVKPGKKEHKLNKENFIKEYGRDDSSKAMIRYFFLRRSYGKRMIFVPLGIGVLTSPFIIIPLSKNRNAQNDGLVRDDYGAIFLVFILAALSGAILALSINGCIMLAIYSRKKLLRILYNYFNGTPLPKRIVKTKLFSMLLKGDLKKHKEPPPNPFHQRHKN